LRATGHRNAPNPIAAQPARRPLPHAVDAGGCRAAPAGTEATKATLDALHTTRPIYVSNTFGHTGLANSRALALASVTAATRDPADGRIARRADGTPTGILEEGAKELVTKLIPAATAADDIVALQHALPAIAAQGVTTILDADTHADTLAAFAALAKRGALTARVHLAPQVLDEEADRPAAAVARVTAIARRYDQGPPRPAPSITVRNAKLYLDGVINNPAFTGVMLEPYFFNAGTEQEPRWQSGTNLGPALYFSTPRLTALLIGLGRAGIDPHMHADGDGAVHAALDAIEAMRRALPGADVRPGIAHDEIVSPGDFGRYAKLGAYPVLSFQWEKRAADTVDQARDYMGPARARLLEPAGFLRAEGAPVAFGSDWPVDRLDEWFALKVAVTRTNDPSAGPAYAGRLGDDPGLTPLEALRAITIVAAQELHADRTTGSLEIGKFADFIVLDRNPLKIPAEDIANVKVLQTVVGGRVVYEAAPAAR
jgi:predicted amidohydrolase YtcJ